MADKDDRLCEHPGCMCQKDKDSDYCSPYCETAGDSTELACDCGHTECAKAAAEL